MQGKGRKQVDTEDGMQGNARQGVTGQGKEIAGLPRQGKREVQTKVAHRQKWPEITGLSGLDLAWAISNLHLKHWGPHGSLLMQKNCRSGQGV